MAIISRPPMTPRSIAPVPTSGVPAPSTSTPRCPNRATTVRAHNWVVLGALLHEPAKPAWFLPISGRLYFRKSQLPSGPDGIVKFRTKCDLAVDLLREQARITKGKHLAVFDGGYALRSVVRRLVLPELERPGSSSSPGCAATLGCLPMPGRRAAAQGEAGTDASLGPETGAAPPGEWLDSEVACRHRLRLWPAADNPMEGDGVPVAGPRLGGAGQSDRGRRRGV